jgi:hypothetical protein
MPGICSGALGWNEPGEDSSLRVVTCKCDDDKENPLHPRRRPRTLRRKDALHIDAKMDAAVSQGKRQ